MAFQKPKKIIESVSKAKLAKARGKRQEHSTRDYPKFLNQLEQVVSTFRKLGYDLHAKKSSLSSKVADAEKRKQNTRSDKTKNPPPK